MIEDIVKDVSTQRFLKPVLEALKIAIVVTNDDVNVSLINYNITNSLDITTLCRSWHVCLIRQMD